jgi:hypothetical protein
MLDPALGYCTPPCPSQGHLWECRAQALTATKEFSSGVSWAVWYVSSDQLPQGSGEGHKMAVGALS